MWLSRERGRERSSLCRCWTMGSRATLPMVESGEWEPYQTQRSDWNDLVGLRKDFRSAAMPGRCRGKEQSVLGKVQAFGQGWKIWSMGGVRGRGEWGITGKVKAGIAVNCECPHLRDGPSEGRWAWVLPGRCSDSWTAMVNEWIPSSHCNVGWSVLICVFLRHEHLDLRTQMEGRC